MIDTSRCSPNIGIHEYTLSIIDREREIPAIHQGEFPPDHSRREWYNYERHWLAKIEQRPRAEELIRCLLATAKRRPAVREELKGIWNVLLQSVATSRNEQPSTDGTEGPAAAHPGQ